MRSMRAFFACAVIAVFAVSVSAQNVRLHVDGDDGLAHPSGQEPGITWINAFKYLPDALQFASQLLGRLEATSVEIWLTGDTSVPYQPHLRAGPDFTQESGSFSDPVGNVSGSWDQCGSTITFTPWTGTGAGTPVTYSAAVPAGECADILDDDPVTSVGNDKWLTGSLGAQNFFNLTGHILFIDFNLSALGSTQIGMNNVQGDQLCLRHGTAEADWYAFIALGAPTYQLNGLSCVDVSFNSISGSQSTFRYQSGPGNGDQILFFGTTFDGPDNTPGQSTPQCTRIHGVDQAAYAYCIFTDSEAWVGRYPDGPQNPDNYYCDKTLFYRCTFIDQNNKGSVWVGDGFEGDPGSISEVWFFGCDFFENPPSVSSTNAVAHYLNCTLDGDPYTPNDPEDEWDFHDATFLLADGVTLRGGFQGDESFEAERPFSGYETILSGDIEQDDNPTAGNPWQNRDDNVLHVLRGAELSGDVTIDRLTIAGGEADGGASNNERYGGGALFTDVEAPGPRIIDCTFYHNYAREAGGGLYLDSTGAAGTAILAEVRDCRFELNGDIANHANDSASGGALQSEKILFFSPPHS